MKMLVLLLFLFIGSSICQIKQNSSMSDVDMENMIQDGNIKRVLDRIFTGYDKKLKPSENGQTEVILNPLKLDLINVKEGEQLAQFLVHECIYWTDNRLEWNISWAGGVEAITIPIEEIWLPPFYAYNAIKIEILTYEKTFYAQISYNGNVMWCRNKAVTVYCELRLDYFPFDNQQCALRMTTASHNIGEMIITGGEVNKWKGMDEFEIESVTTGFSTYTELDGEVRPEVQYTMNIRRVPLHYIVFVVMPTTLTTLVAITGVFLAESNAPIITIGFTTLLAQSYMLNILSTVLPKSGNISLIVYFLIGNMILSVISVFASMILLKISFIFEKCSSAPNALLSRFLCIGKGEKEERLFRANTICGHQKMDENMGPDFWRKTAVLMNSYIDSVRKREENRIVEENLTELREEWEKQFRRLRYVFIILTQILSLALVAVLASFSLQKNTLEYQKATPMVN